MFILSLFLDGFDDSFLELTQDEVYEEVLHEVEFGDELENWLKAEAGYSCKSEKGPCKKSVVLMNLDKEGYVGDKSPDEIIHNVFSERLTDTEYNVRLLERDQQGLNLIYKEINEIELPALLPDPQNALTNEQVAENAEEQKLSERERQDKIGSLIEDISLILAPQDNLFFSTDVVSSHELLKAADSETETSTSVESPNQLESVQLSNEIGEQKTEMLKYLVDQYISVYSCENDFCQDIPEPELPELPTVEVDHADYLLAYKINKLEDEVEKEFGKKVRQTHVKMHVRVINVETGEIEVADTLMKTLTKTTEVEGEKEKKERKEYTPYSSLELSVRPHAPKLDLLQDPPTTLNQFYLTGHSYSKRGYRGSLGLGYGLNNDTNENVSGGDTIDSGLNMFSVVGSVDKILFADKAVKGFIGTGINYSSLNADENVKGRTIEDPNGELTKESDSYFDLSSDEVYAFANFGMMYAYNRWAVELGYQVPYTSLYTNSSIAINENNDLLSNSYVPPSTVRIGVHYKFCGTLPLPSPFSKGNTCQND